MDPEPLERYYLECLDEGRAYQACTASGQVSDNVEAMYHSERTCKACMGIHINTPTVLIFPPNVVPVTYNIL